MNQRTVRRFVLVSVLGLSAAACSSSDSILDSGDESTTSSPTTGVPTTSDGTAPDGGTTATTGSATTAPTPTTTTTPPDSLPPCPVDALDDADGPVEVLFWHGLSGETDVAIQILTAQYNASQSRVHVQLENQGSYAGAIDKYIQSSQGNRPDLIMFPDYFFQQAIDSDSTIPIGKCVAAAGLDMSAFRQATVTAYSTAGIQWAMPFNVSNPVLYYNRKVFGDAGLDPDVPPLSLDDLREYSRAIVETGAASYGIALDSRSDSGGGWFIEQWLANAGEFYADNGNGRDAAATQVLYDGPVGVELLTFLQRLVEDGLAVYVGGNSSGQDNFLKLADRQEPAAMTIGTSAAIGTVTKILGGGLIPGITSDDIGIGPLPGPAGVPTVLVGGAALYIVADHGDETAAAAWDYITFVTSAQAQSEWAARTGYVPVRADALELDPVATKYREDPRFRVPYDQLALSPDEPWLEAPLLGPQRDVRVVTARAVAEILLGGDVQTALSAAAAQANALIAAYNARN